MNFEDDFHLEMSLDGSAFDLLSSYTTRPVIDETLFPPVL